MAHKVARDSKSSNFHHEQGCFVGEFWNDLKVRYPEADFAEIRTHNDWAGIGIIRL